MSHWETNLGLSVSVTFHNKVSTSVLHQFDLGELWTEVTWGSLVSYQCSFVRFLKQEGRKKSAELKEWEKHIWIHCGLTNGKPLSAVMRLGYKEGWLVIHSLIWQVSCLLVGWLIFFFRKVWMQRRPLSWGKHFWKKKFCSLICETVFLGERQYDLERKRYYGMVWIILRVLVGSSVTSFSGNKICWVYTGHLIISLWNSTTVHSASLAEWSRALGDLHLLWAQLHAKDGFNFLSTVSSCLRI